MVPKMMLRNPCAIEANLLGSFEELQHVGIDLGLRLGPLVIREVSESERSDARHDVRSPLASDAIT